MAERVCCLYRVSTTKQVDHDELNQADIPVQRKACREFAEKMGWIIVEEEQEAGVSGFKVSANDRDKLQHIKRQAEQGRFDILLVFMFDRLGRKSDETPFGLYSMASGSGVSMRESSGLNPTQTASPTTSATGRRTAKARKPPSARKRR